MTIIPGWLTKKVFSWSLYDFADTSFSALYITFFFPILIKTYLGGTEFQVGLAMGLSLLTAGILVPFIGALADATGKKMPILFISTVITVALIALTGYAGLAVALILGFLANLFNIIDIDIYDSKIIDIAESEKIGRVSGFGVAMGYVGTIASLAIGYWIMNSIGWGEKSAISAIFITTAIFYFVFSLPLFLFVKDKPLPKTPFKNSLKKAVGELKYTITQMREMKGLGSFLLASFIYNDAMNTIIIFLSLYGTQIIGLSIQEFFFVFALMAIGAFGGSLAAGKISDRVGPKKMISSTLIIWIGIIFYLINIKTSAAFIAGGIIGGAALGAIWTGNRHMIVRLSPGHKIAEIFGIEGLTEKFSGVMGPIVFGFLATYVSYQAALFSIVILLIAGFVILRQVPENKA